LGTDGNRLDMGLFSALKRLVVYGFAFVGLATILFVLFSYGWDGGPPEVNLESPDETE
jgi:hypothetical protein